jgi:hypothetical protein
MANEEKKTGKDEKGVTVKITILPDTFQESSWQSDPHLSRNYFLNS